MSCHENPLPGLVSVPKGSCYSPMVPLSLIQQGGATNGQVLSWDAQQGRWVPAASSAAGITDGDKGHVQVANQGQSWTIKDEVVSLAKLGGDVTIAGKALLDDPNAEAQRTTLGLGTAATQPSTAFAPSSHQHPFTAITGTIALGLVGTAQLPAPPSPGAQSWSLRFTQANGWQIVADSDAPPPPPPASNYYFEGWFLSDQVIQTSTTSVDVSKIVETQTAELNATQVVVQRSRTWTNPPGLFRIPYFVHRYTGTGTDPLGWTPLITEPDFSGSPAFSDMGLKTFLLPGTSSSQTYRVWRSGIPGPDYFGPDYSGPFNVE